MCECVSVKIKLALVLYILTSETVKMFERCPNL